MAGCREGCRVGKAEQFQSWWEERKRGHLHSPSILSLPRAMRLMLDRDFASERSKRRNRGAGAVEICGGRGPVTRGKHALAGCIPHSAGGLGHPDRAGGLGALRSGARAAAVTSDHTIGFDYQRTTTRAVHIRGPSRHSSGRCIGVPRPRGWPGQSGGVGAQGRLTRAGCCAQLGRPDNATVRMVVTRLLSWTENHFDGGRLTPTLRTSSIGRSAVGCAHHARARSDGGQGHRWRVPRSPPQRGGGDCEMTPGEHNASLRA